MMKKEAYYFSHDFGARNDPKLQDVLMECGAAGLGIFWCVIELLYEQCGKIPLRQIKAIAFGLHVSSEEVESIIHDFGLFKCDDEYFWSESVLVRLKKRDDANESRRQKRLAFLRKQKESQLQVNLETTSSQLEDNTGEEEKRRRKKSKRIDDIDIEIKEEIGNEKTAPTAQQSKANSSRIFKPPTIDEVREYVTERNSCVDPETFWNFYEAKGWMVGKNKIKDWKACIRTWEIKERQNGRTKFTQNNGVPRASYGRVGENGQEYH